MPTGERTARNVLTCSFCGRPQNGVPKLVVGPAAVGVCADCVGLASRVVADLAPAGDARTSIAPVGTGACSFCGKAAGEGVVPVRLAAPEDTATEEDAGTEEDAPRICSECLQLCREVLADDTAR